MCGHAAAGPLKAIVLPPRLVPAASSARTPAGKPRYLTWGKANSREMRTSLLEIAGSETSIPLTRYVSLFRNGRTRHFRDVSRC